MIAFSSCPSFQETETSKFPLAQIPLIEPFAHASGTRRASTARKWSVSQGIPSGWKGIPASARPAAVRRPWISAYTIPVPTAAPTVMPPHARRCCGAPAPSMHRTRRCSPDGRGAANRSQTARALRCVRNRRRCLTTFKSQKGRRPGDGSPSFEGAAKAAAL